MKPSELPALLQRHGLASLYLVVGEEDYLRDEAIQVIRSWRMGRRKEREGGTASDDGLSDELLYGDEIDAQEILSRVQEVPFFSDHRLVIVKWADKLPTKCGEALIPYFQSPNESSTLVLSASKLDGRMKWVQTLKSKGMVIDCSPLYDNQRLGWVKQEASTLGLKLDAEAAGMLKDVGGEGLFRVRRELEKLALFVPKARLITAGDVIAVQGAEAGASVFDLAEAIAATRPSQALLIVKKNVEAGEAPLRILGALLWQYRRMWKAKDGMAKGMPESKVARMLGLSPYRQAAFFSLVKRFSFSHFSHAWNLLAEADASLKGGTAGSPHRVFHSLIFELCHTTRL